MYQRFLSKSLLALLLLTISQFTFANDNSQTTNSDPTVKTFYLNLWAPDQVPPAEAKPVEFGINYQYQYTPNSHEVPASDVPQQVVFKFHPDVAQRYQFRWITADQPQFVSFEKFKSHKMKVNVDASASEQDLDIYFEVWVYDTLTGEVVMCDPRVKIIRG